jgi:hypothetical protein
MVMQTCLGVKEWGREGRGEEGIQGIWLVPWDGTNVSLLPQLLFQSRRTGLHHRHRQAALI